jgi:hypothetical protein
MTAEQGLVIPGVLASVRRLLGLSLRVGGIGTGLRSCIALVLLALTAPVTADTDSCTTAGRNLATSLQTCLDSSGMPGSCVQQALTKYENLVRKIDGGCDDEGDKLRDCARACSQDDLSCVQKCINKHVP